MLNPSSAMKPSVCGGEIHGISLSVGTMVIIFGLGTGLMYLVQSYRLKHKLKSVRSFRLPSLEYLQWLNRTSIFVSCAMLTVGLLSGIVLNLNKEETHYVAERRHHCAVCLMSLVGRRSGAGTDQLSERWR